MPRYTTEQLAVVTERMPQIFRVLRAADDAAKGYETINGRTELLGADEALKRLKALDTGALLDALDDWCWHQPGCVRTERCDNAEAR